MLAPTMLIGTLAILLDTVSAHGWVTGIRAPGGALQAGSDPSWWYQPANSRKESAGWNALNQDNGFVEPASAGTNDINCHKSAVPGKLYATVAAGSTVQIPWNTWPDSHKGPIINYIAPCNGDCTTLTPGALRWTKISQAAIVSAGRWVTDDLIKNSFTSSLTIPRNLRAGNYVLRHEIIALHSAGNDNGAQFYPQCVNIKVTGSGTAAPSGGVAGTSLYTRNDPGVKFNLYNNPTSYPFPGPAVWTGAN